VSSPRAAGHLTLKTTPSFVRIAPFIWRSHGYITVAMRPVLGTWFGAARETRIATRVFGFALNAHGRERTHFQNFCLLLFVFRGQLSTPGLRASSVHPNCSFRHQARWSLRGRWDFQERALGALQGYRMSVAAFGGCSQRASPILLRIYYKLGFSTKH
jgi:hypothetical protein